MENTSSRLPSFEQQWREFQQSLKGSDAPLLPYPAERFGDSSAIADVLAELIAKGQKTATCSALWEWEHEDEPLPEAGERTIVLDGNDTAICIIETTQVEIRAYKEIDEDFAFAEGEDDRTLESWREAHWQFFSRVLPKIGREPTREMPLVCERFAVIFQW